MYSTLSTSIAALTLFSCLASPVKADPTVLVTSLKDIYVAVEIKRSDSVLICRKRVHTSVAGGDDEFPCPQLDKDVKNFIVIIKHAPSGEKWEELATCKGMYTPGENLHVKIDEEKKECSAESL